MMKIFWSAKVSTTDALLDVLHLQKGTGPSLMFPGHFEMTMTRFWSWSEKIGNV